MAAHLRSRHIAKHTRAMLLSIALVSAIAAMPRAHAQNNANGNANGNGAQANGKQGAAGNNGAPAPKTAAQKSMEDGQRLLGGPGASLDGYDMTDATPDAQRQTLLNTERMRVAKPNTQAGGGPTAAGDGGGRVAIKRAARGGAAGNGGAAGAGAGAGGQGGDIANAAAVNGNAATVYGSPYSTRASQNLYRSPW
jgi:hypothetical protein